MMVSLDQIVQRDEDVFSAEVDGTAVLMVAESGRYYGMDIVATDIWARLEKPHAVSDLVEDLIGAYEGDPVEISRNTQDVLQVLLSEGLIRVAS